MAVGGPASHAHAFVIDHWPEEIWETAWFLNPTVSTCTFQPSLLSTVRTQAFQRIQSIPGIVHIHVFARKK